MTSLLLALQLAALPAPRADAARQPADRTWDQAEQAVLAFLDEWAGAWRRTERGEAVLAGVDGLYREAAVHCHWPPGPEDAYHEHAALVGRVAIASTLPAHLSCPLWYPHSARRVRDERQSLDNGLASVFRRPIQLQREQLLRTLRAAARRSPGDVRLTGQLVRFSLDAGDLDQARKTADSCRADPVQCQLLRGLVRYRRGLVAEADSVFLAAASLMPERQRCAWNDVGVLLPEELRKQYQATSCAERAPLEARFWWLADPLYGEAGNERRAEHFARKVMISLLTALPGDGRQHFAASEGGEAVLETLLRYGWPAHVHWGGPAADNGHSEWLAKAGVALAPPYVAREYTRGRLHTVPAAAALADPFSASSDRWQLIDPGTELVWWPVEHFARDRGGIVQLEGQGGALRRAGSTRFLWAGTLDPGALARSAGARARLDLFAWHAPSDGSVAGSYQGVVGRKLLIDMPMEPGPVLLGIEIPAERKAPAARTRFGITVPQPLRALPRGARAVSEPLLFEPAADPLETVAADQAVARMYPSTSLPPDSRVGVYWEGYGFAVYDTVVVELRVTSELQPGIMAAVAVAVGGVVQEPAAGASLRWRDEPGAASAIQVDEDRVPVQQRSVTVDLSGLAPGPYRLTIAMTAPHSPTVSSERTFTVR